MPMIKTEFNVLEYVNIKTLNLRGRIVSIHINIGHILYVLEYWYEGKINSVALVEDELQKIKERKDESRGLHHL